MAPRKEYLLFWSFFIFLWWAGAAKEITTRKTKDSRNDCDDDVSSKRAGNIVCGEPVGENCFKYSCYTFNTAAKTWEEGQKDCKKKGGYLVSIEKKEELVFLQEKIKEPKHQQDGGWYIGLSVKEPLWLWVNGKTMTVNHFRKPDRQPDSYHETKAVIDKSDPSDRDFTWNDIRGREKRGSICETEKKGGAITGNGVYCSQTSCYTFVGTEKTWEDSRKECQKRSGDLVSIETESEWAFILNVINTHLRNTKNFKNARGWAIGLEKNPKATWKWSNKASYSLGREVWGESSPYGRSHYAFMKLAKSPKNPVGIFFDAEKDSDVKPYICENNILDNQ